MNLKDIGREINEIKKAEEQFNSGLIQESHAVNLIVKSAWIILEKAK